jgi:hypothetical protein
VLVVASKMDRKSVCVCKLGREGNLFRAFFFIIIINCYCEKEIKKKRFKLEKVGEKGGEL